MRAWSEGTRGRCRRLLGCCGLALVVVLAAGAAPAAADNIVDGNLYYPYGVAVDGSGDVFIADTFNSRVVEDKPDGSGGYTQSVVDTNVYFPQGVAVDGSGDVFTADTGNSRVVEDKPDGSGGYTQNVIDTNLNNPGGVALDGSGDLFIADTGNNQVVEDKPDGSGGYTRNGGIDANLNSPYTVALDGSGDVFIADTFNNQVVEDKPDGSGGYTHSVIDTNLNLPGGVSVDGSGDVFVTDAQGGRMVEDEPNGSGGYTQKVLDTNLNNPIGVAVDASGDVFIAETYNDRVLVHPAPTSVVSAAGLTGTAADGQSLHLNFEFSSLAGPLGHAYRWRRCSDQAMTQNCQTVGTNSRTYKLSSADVGHYITATVTATDTENQTTSSTSPADGPIANPSPPSVAHESVMTGPTEDGQYLRVGRYQFSSPDTLVYHYRWQRCSDFAMTQDCQSVGDGHVFYKLSSVDARRFITATVTATDREGQTTGSTSQVVGPIAPPDPPSVVTQTTVTGTEQQGHTLLAGGYQFSSPDTLTYHYQWQHCTDQAMTQNCVSVGTNSKYYKLTSADTGDYVTATVTATDQENQTTPSTSQAVGPIST